MNLKLIIFFTILVVIISPTIYAQEISIEEKAQQKSVQVVINSSEEIHVKHVINPSNSPKQVNLIDGIKTNISVLDREGNEKQLVIIGDNDSLIVFPSNEDTIIEYDLDEVLFLKNNMFTWNFRYLETTSFIIPKEVELIFVNNRPVYLGEKNGITCHGCQMILEYSINQPKILKNVSWDKKKFPVEIRTFAEINQFNFNQTRKNISFEVDGEKQFVTTIIPLQLLSGPYSVLLGEQKIAFNEYINNGTHVWLTMRPDNSGSVSIIGTTVIDEGKIIQNNSAIANQEIIVYVVIGIVVLVVFIALFMIKKKKLLLAKFKDKTAKS